ncbi:putative DD34D transposase [Trichonephila clavipes]|nr:putative DD34D transposase [Trichonephila clavipes]
MHGVFLPVSFEQSSSTILNPSNDLTRLNVTYACPSANSAGRPVIENVDKITEIIEVDRHVSSPSIAQELKIDHKTVLSHLRKVGLKKNLHVWVPHQLTPKNMDRISICEALDKWNEIDTFLKWMVTGDEKWVPCYNIVRKRLWSKCGEAAQTVAKAGLTASCPALVELEMNHLLGVASAWPNTKFKYLLSTIGPFEASY